MLFWAAGRTAEARAALAEARTPGGQAGWEVARLTAFLGPPGVAEATLRERLAADAGLEPEVAKTLFYLHDLGADVRGQLGALSARTGSARDRFVALCAAAERDRSAARGRLLAEARALGARFVGGEGPFARWLARAARW